MERNESFGTWAISSYKDDEEEEEEALSLCDLPVNEENHESRNDETEDPKATKNQDDFDFCSLLQESTMVAADEVFFKGQILPFRHSTSFETAMAMAATVTSRSNSSSISRSESMERSNSSGFTSSSSRSSSIRSSSGSGSGSSSYTNTPIYKPRIRSSNNQFHSHPSPKPQIKFAKIKAKNVGNSNQNSMWSHFRLGLLTTPEIALHDLKIRSNNVGSRNSSSSSGSGGNMKSSSKKKMNQGSIFYKNGVFFGGCKCSINAVDIVDSGVAINQRSQTLAVKETKQQQQKKQQKEEGKVTSSINRTFEWLKQLSLDEPKSENL